jgi:hypothetical protein
LASGVVTWISVGGRVGAAVTAEGPADPGETAAASVLLALFVPLPHAATASDAATAGNISHRDFMNPSPLVFRD